MMNNYKHGFTQRNELDTDIMRVIAINKKMITEFIMV